MQDLLIFFFATNVIEPFLPNIENNREIGVNIRVNKLKNGILALFNLKRFIKKLLTEIDRCPGCRSFFISFNEKPAFINKEEKLFASN